MTSQTKIVRRQRIGTLMTDSGAAIIVDPIAVFGERTVDQAPWLLPTVGDDPFTPMGVEFSTGYGDYPVYEHRDAEGNLLSIEIVCQPLPGTSLEGYLD